MPYDVITLGETMLRLTPPGQQLIEQTGTLDVHVGGCESNVAVGVARLGWRVAWLSRLTRNSLGRTITHAIQAQGVDTSHVVWTDADRIGVYYLEDAPAPRGSRVVYDRANSAMSNMQPDDLPDDLFTPDNARLLHVSGITAAIGDSAAKTAVAAVTRAKSAGWLVSVDVNHRVNLWSAEQAVVGCDPLLTAAHLIFVALRDAIGLYGAPDDPAQALIHMQGKYPGKVIVMTMGAQGAMGITPEGDISQQPTYPAQGSGRVGGGDAFAAGFISGYLESDDVATGLRWGAAAAAYKYTLPGDMPLLDRDRLADIIADNGAGGIRR